MTEYRWRHEEIAALLSRVSIKTCDGFSEKDPSWICPGCGRSKPQIVAPGPTSMSWRASIGITITLRIRSLACWIGNCQVRRLLASPELVARTITAVRQENGAVEDPLLDESEVIEALGALEPVWDELYPAEQARIMRLLIEGIDVAPDGISVTLHVAGIRSLVAELADQEAPALAASEPLLEAAE
jgi:hypothetical protein